MATAGKKASRPVHPAHRLDEILGLSREIRAFERRVGHARLADLVERGFPSNSVAVLSAYTGLSHKRLAEAASIPTRTLERRVSAKERLKPDESDRLARIARIWAMAEEVFGARSAVERWMEEPNRALDGRRPIDELGTEVAAREVEDLIGRIREGGFA
ncbi:MAG TPA: antitoxin Xre/MbcA/ParS toxin-binding domain-containing protein [Candidatus Dormibacteraeota bacterium]|nr:antitoxin Xre/MbcA/ParS toxin-binding domain-containing protein [Candidatus Dormibacteraeota bacterium]